MASIEALLTNSPRRRLKPLLKDVGRKLTYRIAGLPIAVRALVKRSARTPASKVRRAYARRYWRPKSAAEFAWLTLAVIVWPLAVFGLQIAFVTKNGRAVARRFGRPLHRQLLDQLRLYFTAGVLPPWYYIFELHRQPRGRYARAFIYRWESKGGVMRMLKEGDRAPRSELTDKVQFAAHCAVHNIPTAKVLAVVRNGSIELLAPSHDLETDLFIKPVSGKGGKGAQRWDFVAGAYQSPRGERLTTDALCERLRKRSFKRPLLVQRRLQNHAALARLNNGALSTVRVLTCLDEHGEPEIIGAAMRMAIGSNRAVDNLHAGGIAAAVDVNTGVLGLASNLGADARLGWIDRHPDTGATIAGAQLPMWGEVRAFAIRAHRAFADRVIVGWDIAITPDGPVLVEGNGAPDLDIMQRFVRHGLMAARLGALIAFHLSRLQPRPLR